jgi:AcrR family transcriptional regulator
MDEDKKDHILSVATELFIQNGYKDTSMDEIARRAGVAKGSVYQACESKADLFYRSVHRDLQAWGAQIARYVDPRRSAADILRQMAESGVVYIADHPLVRDLFARVHAGTLPDWAERFDQLRAMGRATVAEVLRMGVRSGEFRSDLDVDEAASVLQDLTHSGYILYGAKWAENPSVATRRIATNLDLVLNGLLRR